LEPRDITINFQRVLDILSGTTSPTTATLNATAVAGTEPFICNAPPLMICDYDDPPGSGTDLTDASNIGRQVRLKEPPSGGSQAWAPGNYGLLAVDGSTEAGDIEEALAAVTPAACYSYLVETATGGKTNKVKNGINARFDITGNPWPDPAPNVITYPRDGNLISSTTATLGNGNWDLDGHWNARHDGDPTPGALTSIAGTGQQATRFQTYLYELGETFWVNTTGAGAGKEVIYPTDGLTIPADYAAVTPGMADVPTDDDNPNDPDFDGEPSQPVAANGPLRRVMEVALLKCDTYNVHGNGQYPTEGQYVEVFITEYVQDPPNGAIYGEVIRGITPLNAPEFYSNVVLSE
jgi:hypothetical protein